MAIGVPPGTAYAYAGVGAPGATLSTVNITNLIMAYGGARAALGQAAAPLVGPPSQSPPGTAASYGNGAGGEMGSGAGNGMGKGTGNGGGKMTASALLSSLSQPLLTTATASATTARFGGVGGTLPVPLPLVAAGSVAGPDGRPLYIGPLAQLVAAQQVRTAALRQAIAQAQGQAQNLNLNTRAESPLLKGDPRGRASPATDAARRRGALLGLNRPNSAKILTSELMIL